MNLLNIGCGSVFHSDWENIDMVSSSPEVKAHDIRRNLPYTDSYFDVCYSSHVIEHLHKQEAEDFLLECHRCLKSQGIIRVVVPDLEAIARNYLKALEEVDAGIQENDSNYDWMTIELYDQTVRSIPGGSMGKFLLDPKILNKDFISSRIGIEAEKYWELKSSQSSQLSFWKKILSKNPYYIISRARIHVAKMMIFLIAGNESMKSFEEGLFRDSGEIHRWMYDRYSLKRLLKKSGFSDARVCQANESQIPNFNLYNLDTIDGKVRKPDSLFIEALKV